MEIFALRMLVDYLQGKQKEILIFMFQKVSVSFKFLKHKRTKIDTNHKI